MAASTEESPAPATATNTTMSTEVTETVKEVITAPAPTPVSEPETVKSKEEETKGDNGPVAESSPSMEPQGASFKEDSYFISELKESEKKALQELKLRVEEALKNNEFTEPPPKEPETKEAEAAEAKEGTKEESKEGGKETETKGEEDAKTPETKVEEVKGTVEEVKIVETISEIDCKVGEEEVKKEETVVTVTEKIEVPAQGDVPKHEETVIVSETVTESVVDSVPLAETTAVEAAETPVEVTVTKETVEVELQPVEDIYLWGVPLLHTHGDERTDVILLKFLRARDFKVSEAFTMLKNTILWRKRFGTDSILEEDFGTEYDGVAYMHGYDKEGHPVCYNVYGVFQDKETYQKSFGDAEKCDRFLRWRVQLLEKGIQQLSFKPGGVNSMVQITDLKNSPGPAKKNLRQATQKALDIFQDNYPELVARKIFVNVPWWYAVLSAMISPFLTQRTKSKFVVARPARVTETLFKYISPEYVPVQYGGLSRENDPEFSAADGGVSELFIKPAAKQIIEIPVTEAGASLVWDIIVVGWEVTYSEEFVPNAEGGYTVIIQKAKKMAIDQEPVRNSFKISEAGKVILTINNTSSKKKRIVYRTKVKNDLQQTA